MRTEINRYMRTVFREEPLDPTLEDFDDKQTGRKLRGLRSR